MSKVTLSTVLPAPAAKALHDAAMVDADQPVGESKQRSREIDRVTDDLKLRHPKYFQQQELKSWQ